MTPSGYCVSDKDGRVFWPYGSLATLEDATIAASLVPGAKVEPVYTVDSTGFVVGGEPPANAKGPSRPR